MSEKSVVETCSERGVREEFCPGVEEGCCKDMSETSVVETCCFGVLYICREMLDKSQSCREVLQKTQLCREVLDKSQFVEKWARRALQSSLAQPLPPIRSP